MKIVPGYNDESMVQHADDQINDGTGTGDAHENTRVPIGDAIESYQGFKTVEVLKDGSPLYSEMNCEALKTITWTPVVSGLVTLTFRLRTKLASAYYVDVTQYVYIAEHENCGNAGT